MRALCFIPWLIVFGCVVGDDDDATVPDDDDTPFDDDDTADDDDAANDDDTADDDDSTAPSTALDDALAVLQSGAPPETLDSLLHDVGWAGRWPMNEGDRWLFATRWDGAAQLALAGDINGWDPSATPATQTASGTHWFALVQSESFAVPAAGAKYKWTDGIDWGAPPEATAYFFDENGRFGYVAPPTASVWAEQFPDLSTASLPLPRTLRALLPAGFVPGAAAHRTLLMHDGQNLFDPEAFGGGWQMNAELAASGDYDDVVLLAVDNTADRLDVYAQVSDEPFGNGVFYGGQADAYLALLQDDVLPHFRARYGIAATGSSLMVAGSSMGGLVSLYLARQWDGQVGCVAALSPTLGWGAFGADGTQALVNLWPTSPGHGSVPIFLYSGGNVFGAGCVDTDGDGVVEDSDDQDNHCTTNQFRDTLASAGYTFEDDLWHWWEPGAQHVEPAWTAQVGRMLQSCTASGWTAAP